jgi:hypothetical protein
MVLANTALCPTQQSSERRWSNKKALLCRSTQSLEVLRWIALPIDQYVSFCHFDSRVSNIIARQPFYEHQTPGDERATLFLQATKVVRRRGPKGKIISVDVPHESFIGSILGGEYQLQRLRSQEDHLDVYTVTNRDGQLFEAQAFSFSGGISENLLHARKRRMKRVLQSQNLIDEIEQAGKRFLISKRSDAEWKNLCSRNQQRGPALRSLESLTEEEFPDLAGSKCRKRSVSSDSAIQAVGDSKLGEEMTLMNRRMEARYALLARLVASLRILAVRAMRKLLQRDLSMIEVRRRVRASSSGKDASGSGRGERFRALLPIARRLKVPLLSRLWP